MLADLAFFGHFKPFLAIFYEKLDDSYWTTFFLEKTGRELIFFFGKKLDDS